jgi:multisubunit Na+/H+ antiporter MnhB subunit
MIATSTVAMYVMMYLNTYSLDHVLWSQTRAWMALYMGAGMAVIMLAYMRGMYTHRNLNIAIFLGAASGLRDIGLPRAQPEDRR